MEKRIENVKTIMEKMIARVPEFTFGQERQEIFTRMLLKLPTEIRRPMRELILSFLQEMVRLDASDIDIGGMGCKGQIWYRVYGTKAPDESLGEYKHDESDILILNLLSERDRETLFQDRSVDFSYSMEHEDMMIRFRATAYFDLNHLSLNMRLINKSIRPLESLGFHANVLKILNLNYVKQGLVLITGITGSGKSTTLDSIVNANNHACKAHIVIISNPIEYVHQPIKAIVRHREVGRDVMSFKDGTIQSLRQDPDIIVIGEMRDAETISTVLEVADSGHKVFTTLHTSSATEAIDRILGETPSSEQNRIRERLADVITCVISQKLVPSMDGRLILAKEVMLATEAIKASIRNNHTDEIYHLIYQGGEMGMVTMEQDLVNLYRKKMISYQEAYSNANNKKRLTDIIKLYQV